MELSLIRELVESEFKLDLSTKDRKRDFVYARNMYFKLSREYTFESYISIGSEIGRNHCTVMHGEKTFDDVIMRFEPKLKAKYLEFRKILSKVSVLEDEYSLSNNFTYKGKHRESLLEARESVNKEKELRHKYRFLLSQMKIQGLGWAYKEEFQI